MFTKKQKQTDQLKIADLWKGYCEYRSSLTVALGRTSNILGELAERIVADFYNAEPLGVSASSADVVLEDKTRIQVKARILKQGKATYLSAIRSWDFDYLAVLLFDESGNIVFGGEIDAESAKEYARRASHINAWLISTSKKFLSDPRFRMLTDEYRHVLEKL